MMHASFLAAWTGGRYRPISGVRQGWEARVGILSSQPIVLIGPGSEWFWSMAQFVVVAVTFLAIYHQLRLQRHTAAIEQVQVISREWTNELMARAKLGVLALVRDGADPVTTVTAGGEIGDFWEHLAYLARAGSIDPRLIYDSLGPATRIWWGILAPSAEVAREQANDRGIWIDFEWLAGVFAGFDRKAKEPATYDAAYIVRRLPDMIDANRSAIKRFEELRAVIVRPLSTPERSGGAARGKRDSPAHRGA
jgi:hypothetical protein